MKAYLANQFGFSETGRYILDNLIKPRIQKIGITILDPFEECKKELNFEELLDCVTYNQKYDFWLDFSKKVEPINSKLAHESDCLLAILDGGHQVDDGVASEIGYYVGTGIGPVFTLRSDFRCGENMAMIINPQIFGYINKSGGCLENTMENWFYKIERWYKKSL